MTKYKTLHGKDGYLFLINDSNSELEQHFNPDFKFNNDTLDDVCNYITSNREKYKNFIFFIIPDKSVIYPEYLPDEYDHTKLQRFSINYIKTKVGDDIDLYNFFMQRKSNMQTHYKTDTHISELMGLEIVKHVLHIIDSKIEIQDIGTKTEPYWGDLMSEINNGTRYCENEMAIKLDHNIVYSTVYLDNEMQPININTPVEYWTTDIDRRNIIVHLCNEHVTNNHRLLLFGTSFSYMLKDIYILFVKEVYFIYSRIRDSVIEMIQPTYIINERVERGLHNR